jgi:hypothetical protein
MLGSTARPDWRGFRLRAWTLFALVGTALVSALTPLRKLGLTLPLACAAVVAAFWHDMLRCPGCGKTFFRKGPWHNGLARFCLNCGLKKGQGPP